MFGALRTPRNMSIGFGQRFALAGHVARLGSRALFLTDARLGQSTELKELVATLTEAGIDYTVYDGVEAELPAQCLTAGVAAGMAFGPDVVIGIGGGSCLDAAKVVALLMTHGGTPSDYYGEFNVPGPIMPLIAIPTTAGTGSEVTPVAVVDDPGRAIKVGIASPYLIPDTAICDPELTLTCPPELTAVSGADALVHAIEALTTLRRLETSQTMHEHVFVGKNVLSDHHSLAAIEMIGSSLARAVSHGSDVVARQQMMLGAMHAGLAFGTAGTSACHAVQYPVGALTHTAHGLGVALMLPYALTFNRDHALSDIAKIGRVMAFADADAPDIEAADAAIVGLEALLADIGIPRSLEAIGVRASDLDWIAEHALSAVRLIKNNPRPIDRPAMNMLVAAAFHGDRSLLASTLSEAV
jgi:alcohol dehydrogenase class IV